MATRIDDIKKIIVSEKSVDVTDLSRRLGVSEVTIRKYLSELEGHGFCVRRYGGAVLAENPQQVINYLSKESFNKDKKETISQFATSLIKDGENILVDAGSTNIALARALIGRRVCVVTNSLAVAEVLSNSNEAVVEVIGGSLRKASGALVGPRAVDMLNSQIRVDKAFIGCSGFDEKLGFSSENAIEAETKQAMLRSAREGIIVCDSSKFNRPAFASFATLDEVDTVVTDSNIEADVEKLIKDSGTKVLTT